jgi:hypothetical protein
VKGMQMPGEVTKLILWGSGALHFEDLAPHARDVADRIASTSWWRHQWSQSCVINFWPSWKLPKKRARQGTRSVSTTRPPRICVCTEQLSNTEK